MFSLEKVTRLCEQTFMGRYVVKCLQRRPPHISNNLSTNIFKTSLISSPRCFPNIRKNIFTDVTTLLVLNLKWYFLEVWRNSFFQHPSPNFGKKLHRFFNIEVSECFTDGNSFFTNVFCMSAISSLFNYFHYYRLVVAHVVGLLFA